MTRIRAKVFCEKKGRNRIAFKTREKADFFIEHYDEYMEGVEVELKPVRSFYCISCGMWHITHFPPTPESARTEDRDRKIQQLEVLSQRLKAEFRQADWQAWKPIVEEGMELLAFFREKPGFEKLVESTETQLEHCSAIIRTTEAKETGAANDEFKLMRKSIEQKAKALDYEGFEQEVYQLVSHFRDECLRKALMPANKEFLTSMTGCMEYDDTMPLILYVLKQAKKSIPDSREVKVDDLFDQVLDMTRCMDELFIFGLPRSLWDILQNKVKKITSVLDNSFKNCCSSDGYPLKEMVRIVASRKLIMSAYTFIGKGNKDLAMKILQLADERMSQLPLSDKKVDLMKRLCELGKELFD